MVAMEDWRGAHHLARTLGAQGIGSKIIAAKFVNLFVVVIIKPPYGKVSESKIKTRTSQRTQP